MANGGALGILKENRCLGLKGSYGGGAGLLSRILRYAIRSDNSGRRTGARCIGSGGLLPNRVRSRVSPWARSQQSPWLGSDRPRVRCVLCVLNRAHASACRQGARV